MKEEQRPEAKVDKQQKVALERYLLIAPLLEPGMEPGRWEILLKERTREGNPVSKRTVRRYLAAYREEGFTGYTPKPGGTKASHAPPPELLEQAMVLKSELPQRSVRKIVEILEGEERVKEGQVKASTLARHFARARLMQLPKNLCKKACAGSRGNIATTCGRWTSSAAPPYRTRKTPKRKCGPS